MTIKDIEDRYERALQAALMLDLANPLGLPVLNIDPRAVATICRSADDVSKLLDVAKAAKRVSRFLVESPYYQGEKIDGAFDLEAALEALEAS